MTSPFVVPPLLLALVLAVSAVLKLTAPSTVADAFVSLRLPAWLRSTHLPTLLPYGELLLALALVLLPAPAYVVVTVVTALLFLAYLVVIVRALGFEDTIECGCFGRLGLGEVDRRTALRNVLLVVLATVAVGDAMAGHSAIDRLRGFGGADWGWLVGVALGIVVTWLIVGRTVEAVPQDPAFGAGDEAVDYERRPIPYGALRDRATAEAMPLFAVGRGRPALLVFVNLTCGPCVRTMEMLPDWARQHTAVRTIAVPPGGGFEELPDLGPSVTWMEDPAAVVAQTFDIRYPAAVLLGVDGLLAGGPESGFEGIRDFLREISQQLSDAGIAPDGVPLDAEEVDADPPSPVQSSPGREA